MQSVTTPMQIRNNPSNSSTSKHLWSFSKAQRFKVPKNTCKNAYYSQKSTLSNRRSSFGVGDRSKYFEGKKGVPEPGHYALLTDFDNKANKGFSFGENRQNLKFDHFQKGVEVTPDPSKYDVDSDLVRKKRAYSLRQKTAYPTNYFLPNQYQIRRKKSLPGPGNYKTIDQLSSMKYFTRSINPGVRSFHGGERFVKQKSTPGPSDYPLNSISPDGIYLLSNMKGSGRRAILSGRRELKLEGNKETPGPGTYRNPSQFGHYEKPARPATATN